MAAESLSMVVTPAAAGAQFVRVSVPMPRGMLAAGDSLKVEAAATEVKPVGVRVVTWYPEPAEKGVKRSARRAIVSFPWNFADRKPVEFRMTVEQESKSAENHVPPVEIEVAEDQVRLTWPGCDPLELHLDVPPRVAKEGVRHEVVESHAAYRWDRFHFDDPQWPRMIETRADAAGGVVIVAHLQRRDSTGDFAP